ncbi:hypothetical protein RN001_007117 [Aquatica leii]|uniref:Uncharacterized protein n=1 Tax=Aquatica leii TaxID=1421715 RepID=A0AAN7S8Z1_9COLE|nr:hypothetical protein RN001_007117 [Aquatica leii]
MLVKILATWRLRFLTVFTAALTGTGKILSRNFPGVISGVSEDFNEKVGKEKYYKTIITKNILHEESNDNGQRLINLASSNYFIIGSTRFMHKKIHKEIWIKKFFKEIRTHEKRYQPRVTLCKDAEGNYVGNQHKVVEKWREYFEELLILNKQEITEVQKIKRQEQQEERVESLSTQIEIEIIRN